MYMIKRVIIFLSCQKVIYLMMGTTTKIYNHEKDCLPYYNCTPHTQLTKKNWYPWQLHIASLYYVLSTTMYIGYSTMHMQCDWQSDIKNTNQQQCYDNHHFMYKFFTSRMSHCNNYHDLSLTLGTYYLSSSSVTRPYNKMARMVPQFQFPQ